MNQLDEAIDEANQRLASLVAEEIEKGIQNYVGIAGSERERILVDRVVALHREREEALAENQRLRKALGRVRQAVGTSTEAWHIANDALEGK